MLELLAMVSLALSWLLPNHYFPWNSFYLESAAAFAVLLITISFGRHWFKVSVPSSVWFVAVAAAIPAVQWMTGLLHFSGDAWVSSLYVMGFAAAIAAGYVWGTLDGEKAAAGLAMTMLAGASLSSVLAIAQAIGIQLSGIYVMDAIPGMRAYANLGQPNNLATLIGFGAAGLLLLRERGSVGGVLAGALLLLLVVAASATQSRSALLFGPIFLAGLLFARRRGVRFITSPWEVGAAIATHWVAMWFWPSVQELLLLSPTESLAERGGQSLRFVLWKAMFVAAGQSPWYGYGWLQVGEAHLAVADLFPPTGELWMHAHNLFVDLLVWCGYPIALLLIAGILYWWASRWRLVATMEHAIGLMVITAFGWHSMLELPHHYAYFLVPIGLWVGLVDSAAASPRSNGPLSVKWNLVPGLAALVMALAIWKDYSTVEEDYRLIRFENLGIGSVRASQAAPDAPFMSAQTAFLRVARMPSIVGMSEATLLEMEAVTKRYPYGRALARLAQALALNGRLQDAVMIYVKIRHIHGEAMYAQVRQDLRREIERGNESLIPLYEALSS